MLKLVPQSVRAAVLAAKYHAKQTDLDGRPYVNHLRRVSRQTATAEESTVAWLHDIIEDTPVIATDLRDLGFSDRVVEAVLSQGSGAGQGLAASGKGAPLSLEEITAIDAESRARAQAIVAAMP